MNENLYAFLAERFPDDADAPCLILPHGRRVSYAELESQSARYANLLVEAGLKRGDRVAAQVGKSPETLYLYLGCLRAGCVFLPLNPACQRGEVAYFLDDAKPGLFVCRPETFEQAQELAWAARVPLAHDLGERGEGSLAATAAEMPTAFETTQSAGSDLAAILYTSGTTGRAKGAMLSHRNLAANARALHKYWGFQPGDVLLHMLPTYHVHGLIVATHCALLNGSPILFEPNFDPQRALLLMQDATVFMGMPTYYTRLLQERGLTREAVAHMRLFISGSAPLLPETFDEFRARTGHILLECYGMTEGGMITSNPLDAEGYLAIIGRNTPC